MRICFTGRPGPTDELMIQQLAEAGFRLEVVAFPAPRDAGTELIVSICRQSNKLDQFFSAIQGT